MPNAEEKTYETMPRECLALVCAVLYLRVSLEPQRSTTRKDYDESERILNDTNSTGQLVRENSRFPSSNLMQRPKKGFENQFLDVFSRFEPEETYKTLAKDDKDELLVSTV